MPRTRRTTIKQKTKQLKKQNKKYRYSGKSAVVKTRYSGKSAVVKTRRTFRKSRVPPRRSVVMRGGDASFPASLSNSDVAVSPQSYLPYNNFTNDPGYGVIAARNTGPFLTGVVSGGKRRKKFRGGSQISTNMSNVLNTTTNSVGTIASPAFSEISGVSGVMSGFSGTGSAYSSAPVTIARIA